MLNVIIIGVLLLAVTAAAVRAGCSWRRLVVSVVVLEVLGFALLGLPGAVFLETLQPVMERAGARPMSADGAWPAAILMSFVWPAALVPAYLAVRSLHVKGLQRGLVLFAVLLPASLIIGTLVYVIVA
jgi:hypothetical protein